MLYRPDQFLAGFETDPASVFVRTTPFSSNREVREIRMIGASTRGASGFMGTEAVLEEAPLPLEWIMETLQRLRFLLLRPGRLSAASGELPSWSKAI